MDIFKQNRYLWIAIIILLVMNLTALSLLWLGRPEVRRLPNGPKNPVEEKRRIEYLLQKELGFDKNQTEQYLRLHREHRNQMRLLNREITEIKRQMFDEVLAENPQTELSDSLLKMAQGKQAKVEKLTFQHFLTLKKLCKPEQQDNLKILMHEIFRPNPPQGRDDNSPPSPPPGDRMPPPPRNK